MFSPYLGFMERDIVGTYKVSSAAASGLAMMLNVSDTSPNTPGVYANSLGSVVPASITTTASNKEIGWLLQPVTTSGPSILSLISSVYDESVAAGQTAAICLSKSNAIIATDQYVTTTADATYGINPLTATLNAPCGIVSGQPRLKDATANDAERLLFVGAVYQRQILCGLFSLI